MACRQRRGCPAESGDESPIGHDTMYGQEKQPVLVAAGGFWFANLSQYVLSAILGGGISMTLV